MYCGITIKAYGDLDILKTDTRFVFKESGNKCYKSTYRGMHIQLDYEYNYAQIRGSIHKFKNGGLQNYDMFTISQFLEVAKEFEEIFSLDKFNQKYFSALEFGVNINLGIDPCTIINSIIPYCGTGQFESEKSSEYYGIRIIHDNYYHVKLYDKTHQITLNKKNSADYKTKYVLRLEIKVYNAKFLHKLLANTSLKKLTNMSDLAHYEALEAFNNKLIEEFNKLIIVDRELLDSSKFSPKENRLYNEAWQENFWEQYKCSKTLPIKEKRKVNKRKERVSKKLKKIVDHNNELKSSTREHLISSLNYIIDVKNVANSTIWSNPKSEVFLWKKKGHSAYGKRLMSQIPRIEKENKEITNNSITDDSKKKKGLGMSQNLYLDKLGLCDKELQKYRCCPITGLPLFVNHKDSKFLSMIEIDFYYNNHPEIYSLLLRLISPEYSYIPINEQIKKIAQAIRNKSSYKNKKRIRRYNPKQLEIQF